MGTAWTTKSARFPTSIAPGLLRAPERVGGVERGRGDRLVDRTAAAPEAGEPERRAHRLRRAGPGIEVGGDRDRHAGLDQPARRRPSPPCIRKNAAAGSRTAPSRPGRAPRSPPPRRARGDRPRPRRAPPRARPSPSSASWSAWSRTPRPALRAPPRGRGAPRRGVNACASTKASAYSARPARATAGSISSTSGIDVAAAVVADAPGGIVCAPEEGRHDLDRMPAARRAQRLELLELRLERQPVAALGLDRASFRAPASRRGAAHQTTARARSGRRLASPARWRGSRRRAPRSPSRSRRASRSSNSRSRQPANGRCVCASTKPGSTVPPAASTMRAPGRSSHAWPEVPLGADEDDACPRGRRRRRRRPRAGGRGRRRVGGAALGGGELGDAERRRGRPRSSDVGRRVGGAGTAGCRCPPSPACAGRAARGAPRSPLRSRFSKASRLEAQPADLVLQGVELVLRLLEDALGLDARLLDQEVGLGLGAVLAGRSAIRCAVTSVSWRVRSRSGSRRAARGAAPALRARCRFSRFSRSISSATDLRKSFTSSAS